MYPKKEKIRNNASERYRRTSSSSSENSNYNGSGERGRIFFRVPHVSLGQQSNLPWDDKFIFQGNEVCASAPLFIIWEAKHLNSETVFSQKQ